MLPGRAIPGRKFLIRNILPVLLAYLVLVFSLLFTSDTVSGLQALLLKLPLLLLPLAVMLQKPFSPGEYSVIIITFITGVLISTISGTVMLIGSGSSLTDGRQLSPFVSHIRLSVMVVVSLVLLAYLRRQAEGFRLSLVFCTISAAWLLTFMLIMQSLTGFFLLGVLAIWLLINVSINQKKFSARATLMIVLAGIPAVLIILLFSEFNRFRQVDPAPLDFDLLTLSGNSYTHQPGRIDSENGNSVWLYICDEELEKEWKNRSEIDYFGKDLRGHDLRVTLIRFLASKGEKKDSSAISRMSDNEISLVENGYANMIYLDGSRPEIRLYEIFWQLDYYLDGGNPQGHSVTQRLYFMKNGIRVALSYPITGTGIGDVRHEIAEQYDRGGLDLSEKYRLMPHNQFITSALALGFPLALIFWAAIIFPLLVNRKSLEKLLLLSTFLTVLSFLWEDGLETHTGVSLFSFFYALTIASGKWIRVS